MEYTKLSLLVNDTFTVKEAKGYTFKKYVPGEGWLKSDEPQKGYSKKYFLITDKGGLELGSGQLSSLLEAVYSKGEANINSRTFKVTSNGKFKEDGKPSMDIRYYFTAVREDDPIVEEKFNEMVEKKNELKRQDTVIEDIDDEVDLSLIPF